MVFDTTKLRSVTFTAQKAREDFRFKYDEYDRITNVTSMQVFSIVGADNLF